MKPAGWSSTWARVGRAAKGALTHNLGLKIIAIVMAILLFSLVRGSEDAQRSVFVDVLVLLPPPEVGTMLVSEVPDRVKVTLRGSRSVLNSLREEDLEPVQIDLREPSRGYYYFEPDDFELPAGAEVIQLAPASVPLTWAERVVQDVPVLARLGGSPPPGLTAQAVDLEPETVRVRGAETEVKELEHVATKPVDVSGLSRGRHERRAQLTEPPPHTQFDRASVRVILEVTDQEAERSFVDVPVTAVGGEVQVRPEAVDLTLWGSSASLEQVKREHLVPVVDVTELDPAKGTQPLPVSVRGMPDGLQVKVVPDTVLVTLRPGG